MKILKDMTREEKTELVVAFYVDRKPLQYWDGVEWCHKSERASLIQHHAYRIKPTHTVFGELTGDEQKELLYQVHVKQRGVRVYSDDGTFLGEVLTVRYWAADQAYEIY